MIRWTLWLTLLTGWAIALEVPVPNPSRLADGQVSASTRYWIAKGMHLAVYAGLALSAGWLRIPVRYRWLMMFFLMAHATVTELLQVALEEWCNRGGLLSDVAYDQLGIAIGWKWWMRTDEK
ncbi:MAG: hypothetical protein EXS16_02315 [Gemmataceae bacterium]|nr:hypothetical protein [Gemmataceae bacterium]